MREFEFSSITKCHMTVCIRKRASVVDFPLKSTMEPETDEDISETLDELEKSVSLCSLCVLEIGCDVYEHSTSFAPSPLSIDESSFIVSLEQTKIQNDDEDPEQPPNYVSKFGNTTIFNDKKIIQDQENSPANDTNKNGGFKLTPPSFDDDDDVSQSFLDVLSCLAKTKSQSRLNKPSQNSWNDIDEIINDSDAISEEIEIARKFSQTTIERIINDDKIFIENRTNFDHEAKLDKRASQVDDPNKMAEKEIETFVDKKNYEPSCCYNSDVADDVIPKKKTKYDAIESHNESLMARKREKSFDPIESCLVQTIPCKKPKIIADEMIKINRKILPRNLMIFPSNFENQKTTTSNDNHPIVTKIIPSATKSLNNVDEIKSHRVESNNSTNEPQKVEIFGPNSKDREKILLPENFQSKATKIERKETKMENLEIGPQTNFFTPTSTKNLPIYPPLHPKNIGIRKRPPPTLKILQNKIAKSYQLLVDGAEDLKNLSLFIDELRESFSTPESQVASEPKKLIKKFVCTSTQTRDIENIPNYYESKKIPIVKIGISTIESKSTENKSENKVKNASNAQNSVDDHNRFCEPLKKQNVRANVEDKSESQKSCTSPPIDVETEATRMENQQENSTMIDQNYNRLRPRRWPNNRYDNSRTLRSNRLRDLSNRFPPLPIVNKGIVKAIKRK